jgi:hypothetical protein
VRLNQHVWRIRFILGVMVPVLCCFGERSYFGFGFAIMRASFSGVNILDCKEIQYLALSSSVTPLPHNTDF